MDEKIKEKISKGTIKLYACLNASVQEKVIYHTDDKVTIFLLDFWFDRLGFISDIRERVKNG
jgi:hypothetical protein